MMTLQPDLLDAAERARLRAALDAAGWQARFVADRHRLQLSPAAVDAALLARLCTLAARTAGSTHTSGSTLRPLGATWLRLRHGDYQLMKDDALERPAAAHVEVIADLSAAPTGEAEIFYSDGARNLVVVPQLPGSVAVVARTPAMFRYQRYLGLRVGDAVVYRLRLTLASSP